MWPVQDTARLTEAFRRAVLRWFVRLALFDDEPAAGMRTGPHSGFHVHTAVWVPEEDRAFATRRARYRAPTGWRARRRPPPIEIPIQIRFGFTRNPRRRILFVSRGTPQRRFFAAHVRSAAHSATSSTRRRR